MGAKGYLQPNLQRLRRDLNATSAAAATTANATPSGSNA